MAFLAGALGNLEGQAERQKDDRAAAEAKREFDVSQAGEDKRNQAYVDATTASINNKNAQTQKILTDVANMPRAQALQYLEGLAKLHLIDAQTRVALEGTLPLDEARTIEVGAQTGLVRANTQKVLHGEIPLLVAQAAYQRQRPEFERAQLAEKYYALQDQDKRTADQIASRVQIAGANDATKRAIAAIMVQSGLYKQDEGFALKSAIDEYNNEFKSYLQQTNPRYANPDNPTQVQQPNISVPLTINLGDERARLNAGLNSLGNKNAAQSNQNNPSPPVDAADEVKRARAAIQQGAPRAQVEATLRKRIGDAAYQQLYVGTQVAPRVPIGKPVIQGISPALLGQ